jgi:hypothetical protein
MLKLEDIIDAKEGREIKRTLAAKIGNANLKLTRRANPKLTTLNFG